MTTVRTEIAVAVRDGLGSSFKRFDHRSGEIAIFVADHIEPILVRDDDVILPDDLKHLASGIHLDVAAILAERRMR